MGKMLTIADVTGDHAAAATVIENASTRIRHSARVTSRNDITVHAARLRAGDDPADVLGPLDRDDLHRYAATMTSTQPPAAVTYLLGLGDDFVDAVLLNSMLRNPEDQERTARRLIDRWDLLDADSRDNLADATRWFPPKFAGQLLAEPTTPIELYLPLLNAVKEEADSADMWRLCRRILDAYDRGAEAITELIEGWVYNTPQLPALVLVTLRTLADHDDGRFPSGASGRIRWISGPDHVGRTFDGLRHVLDDDPARFAALGDAQLDGLAPALLVILAANPHLDDTHRIKLIPWLHADALAKLLTFTVSPDVLTAVATRALALPGGVWDHHFLITLERVVGDDPTLTVAAARALPSREHWSPLADRIEGCVLSSAGCDVDALRLIPWSVMTETPLEEAAGRALAEVFTHLDDTAAAAFAALINDRPHERFGDLIDVATAIAA